MLAETDILKDLNSEKWEKSITEAVKWQQKHAAFDELTQVSETHQSVSHSNY